MNKPWWKIILNGFANIGRGFGTFNLRPDTDYEKSVDELVDEANKDVADTIKDRED